MTNEELMKQNVELLDALQMAVTIINYSHGMLSGKYRKQKSEIDAMVDRKIQLEKIVVNNLNRRKK